MRSPSLIGGDRYLQIEVRISVCLETVFTDVPAAERVGKIAEAGFRDIEFWHPEATFDGSGREFWLQMDSLVDVLDAVADGEALV